MSDNVFKLYRRLTNFPELETLTMDQLQDFIEACCEVRHAFMIVQRSSQSSCSPPSYIPEAFIGWLADVTYLDLSQLEALWKALKEHIWTKPRMKERSQRLVAIFERTGWKRGIPLISLHPPNTTCTNSLCDNNNELRRQDIHEAVVFTLEHGVQMASLVNFTCGTCRHQYHHNYYIHDDNLTRTFYDEIPEYIEVDNHHYIDIRLMEMFTTAMRVSSTSATACAKIYEDAFARNGPSFDSYYSYSRLDPTDFALRFSPHMTPEQIWVGFTVLALLRDRKAIGEEYPLSVPHQGSHRDRYETAMRERNERIVRLGQPELRHYCDGCMRVWEVETDEGIKRWKCQVAVSDGITIGHFVCKIFRCLNALDKKTNHFCDDHKYLANICAVENCERSISPTERTKSTCDDKSHRDMEIKSRNRGQSMFALKERLARCKTSRPEASIDEETDTALLDDSEEWYEIDSAGNILQHVNSRPVNVGVADDVSETVTTVTSIADASSTSTSTQGQTKPVHQPKQPKRFKILLARRRSCCEVTIVWPCGVILARATLVGAEAVSNVLDFVKRVFTIPGAQKPEHWIYDTACDAKRQAQNDPWWDDVGMCVDPFHLLNKHKETHEYCQLHCNPADYPELLSDDGKSWWFNSSIAEQVNVWLGSYHAMLREMTPTRYDFFLDEMVRLRNAEVVSLLKAKGKCPNLSPLED
ncbi:hypothetical protein CONPUDRAFT_155153 [Coniophora puteana RWD-64-598 SS2]|uniref:CxC5 like cysteine cluster associated with KDZ domain-containing protein n=1 Tax=Coniophora puteana (strain RWD-64-598) TaxID=741705 RepID=A0A5M3ML14_CONPW|nr:uncharacterized protein CONPUDRAFT_155153 [Coniophora puteana RWD-64-598 SS2]EIW79756.1 hypothetical protein CONPUDRAFT_155153 [Coniophora puteana RWD-64-598 SS2]